MIEQGEQELRTQFVGLLRKIACLCLFLALTATTALSRSPLPETNAMLSKLISDLSDCGYEFDSLSAGTVTGLSGSTAIFGRHQSGVVVLLDDQGVVRQGGLTFGPQADLRAAEEALCCIYTVLQLNMGKKQILDKHLALSRVRNLIDAVVSSLKVVSESKFRADGLNVKATRNDKTKFISIKLWP